MNNIYGGGIPFSAVLNEKKTKKHSRTHKRRKTRRTSRKKDKSLKTCKCKINKNINSPQGLGFCPKCQPLNVIMRGKDDNLWKIEKINNLNRWIKIN